MSGKIKVVFLATPDIALESFKYFINSPDYELKALVSQPLKAQNRGKKIVERNIVKIAKENNVEIFLPEKISKDEILIEKLKSFKPDFLITFAFGQILSQEVIDIARIATINLHASLLPEYRGANPISQAIADGKTKTGITTMKTVLELDAGDICLQEEIEITPEMNVIELMELISHKSPKLLNETLKGLINGTITPIKQDSNFATFTKKIKKEEKEINWNLPADVLHNKIRAMYQINTNHTTYKDKIVKILKTNTVVNPIDEDFDKGQVVKIEKDGIIIKCGKGALKIITLKPEGKGEMNAADWARGARIKIGDCFK